MTKWMVLALLSVSVTSAFAEIPEGFYQERTVRTEAKSIKAAKARKLAQEMRDELVEQAEADCHELGGEFVVGKIGRASCRERV